MATTFDLILNNNGNDGDNSNTATGQQQSETPPVVNGSENPVANNGGNNGGGSSESANPDVKSEAPGGGYESLFRQLNPYKPPTQEELEKERKKQKRDQIFAAIGDGISALSNLFFTTKGAPNMYTGKDTMSEKTKIRYDKLMSDRESKNAAYFSGLMKARQADAEAADKERAWKRQLGIDEKNDARYEAEQQYKKGRDKIADERYEKEQQAQQDRWQQNFDEQKRRADRTYNFNVQQHKDDVTLQREKNQATAARGVRGKQLGFSDGQGNQVSIYENVWKGSMQQVFNTMLEDNAPTDEKQRSRWEREMKKYDTPQKKEDYVKQNWHKSPKASNLMLALSKIDPATMTSEINDDEVVDYTPNSSNEEEIIDYTPGK